MTIERINPAIERVLLIGVKKIARVNPIPLTQPQRGIVKQSNFDNLLGFPIKLKNLQRIIVRGSIFLLVALCKLHCATCQLSSTLHKI